MPNGTLGGNILSNYLAILLMLILLFIYGLLIYRIFVQRTNRWLRENIGLTFITMFLALSSDVTSLVKAAIIFLSCGFLFVLIYRYLMSKGK